MLAENKPTVSTNTASHPTLTKKSRRPLRVADVGALGLLADSASLSVLGPMAKAYTHCNPCSMYFAENGIHHLGSGHPRAAFSLEVPSIGWQLFILESSQSDSTAFPSCLDTYATRLLTEPLSRQHAPPPVFVVRSTFARRKSNHA